MYSLKILLLEDCFYSIELKKLLSKKEFNKIQIEYINIKQVDKERYKTSYIKTFPQVYMIKKHSDGKLLVGGYDSINKIIDIVKHNSDKNMDKNMSILSKIYPLWATKAKLRLLELFTLIK